MPEENAVSQVNTSQADENTDVKNCSTCLWWTRARPVPGTSELWGLEMFPFGECRGMPPSALAGSSKRVAPNDTSGEVFVEVKQARFPHTNHDDWCGMWKAGA